MKKYKKKINVDLLSAVEVYNLVLSGELKRFPYCFWAEVDSAENAKDILKYLIEEILNWSEEDIKKKYTAEVFFNHKLRGLLIQCFDASPFKALDYAYPGRFLPWELPNTPNSFWTDDNCKKATYWLLEDVLNWRSTDQPKKICQEDFIDNGLHGMLSQRFDNSPYKAINHLYPGRFKEWEVTNIGRGFWTRERGIEAARWLFEEKLKWTETEVIENVSTFTFIDNDLNGMLRYCFDGSPYKLIEAIYPEKYKEWDMKYPPRGFWTRETSIKAIRNLFDNKLNWSHHDITQNLNSKTLIDNGLSAVYNRVFNQSAIAAINAAYPGEFKEWEFKNFKYIEWTKEKAIEAIKWLIESKLKWSEEDIKKKITLKTFAENDLYRLIGLFDYSAAKAVMEAYPGKYVLWEFRKVPRGYWNLETGIQATKWLIEQKLHWNDEDIKKKLTRKVFEDNHLSGMIQICFHKDVHKAIDAAYPNRFIG